MIDLHYGLATDSFEHAVSLLDALAPAGGRSEDTEIGDAGLDGALNRLISRHFVKPSDGLEASTPLLARFGMATSLQF
jgi:hypothetical protein